MLNDFDALLQMLFAEQSRVAVEHLNLRLNDEEANVPPPQSKLYTLRKIWNGLLPHRQLDLKEASVAVLTQPEPGSAPPQPGSYAASEMSDGERIIFYFLGQSLLAPREGVIIVDEPENHVHRAVQARLWDAIEAERSDCAFIYMTHDLEFAAERPAAAKYFIRAYWPANQWDIEQLPFDTGLPDHVVAEIVGSRKPILFVEGEPESLDHAIYRNHYSNFTIIPRGSCDDVIHSVGTFRGNAILTRIGEVQGLIDADDRDSSEITYLSGMKVYVLPVAEVENLLLLPNIFVALADALQCSDPGGRLGRLQSDVMTEVRRNLELVAASYTSRRVDRALKKVDLAAKDVKSISAKLAAEVGSIVPADIYTNFKSELEGYVNAGDLESTLKVYDNKGLFALASKHLGLGHPRELRERVSRLLGRPEGAKLRTELQRVLPIIP